MSNHKRTRTKAGLGRGLLLFSILSTMMLGGAAQNNPTSIIAQAQPMAQGQLRADPVLLQRASQQPGSRVAVIVQKTSAGSGAEALVQQAGGKITADLHIINAFAADIPVAAVPDLAGTGGVRWVSYDAPVVKTTVYTPADIVSSANLTNAYTKAIGADRVWSESSHYEGQNIGVAVVDSGVNPQQDLYTATGKNRLVGNVAFNSDYNHTVTDGYGHGTHVAGIIAGNGSRSGGQHIGIAPLASIINVKVSNDDGSSTASDVVSGLQWVNDHKNDAGLNIRVVNISLNSTSSMSYNNDPIDAAAEILWFNKVVVVVAAGNNGSANLYAPANDPFVITVGATDDKGTASTSDDTLASFSAYGTLNVGTITGNINVTKPDLVAPGTNIVSLMANSNMGLPAAHPANIVNDGTNAYFRMSGTSMAAPMVSGAAALLIQSNPSLTPDQVKYRLKATAHPFDTTQHAGAGYVDVYAAIHGSTLLNANTGFNASQLLWTGSQALTWGTVNWNSVNWNSVNWNSVNWNSVNWNSVNWNSDYWGTP